MGTLTSWNPLGHAGPVTGLIFLYLCIGAGKLLRKYAPRLSTNFEEIISLAFWNFEEENKVLESLIIVNNISILIINEYCNYIYS